MSDNPSSYQSALDNLKPEKRKGALRTLIEIGGLDRDLMIELRQQFLALTKGEEHERTGKHQQA
jgi:hypothetical protein